MDETSSVALALRPGVPTYQVEDEEGRSHLLIHPAIEEQHEHRWCLWRPDHERFDSRFALLMTDRRSAQISSRKEPKQARSAELVATILDAAAQVLAKEGAQRFTTARVAEKDRRDYVESVKITLCGN